MILFVFRYTTFDFNWSITNTLTTNKLTNLKAKRDTLLSPVLLGRELGGDAVNFDEDAGLPGRVPGEVDGR